MGKRLFPDRLLSSNTSELTHETDNKPYLCEEQNMSV